MNRLSTRQKNVQNISSHERHTMPTVRHVSRITYMRSFQASLCWCTDYDSRSEDRTTQTERCECANMIPILIRTGIISPPFSSGYSLVRRRARRRLAKHCSLMNVLRTNSVVSRHSLNAVIIAVLSCVNRRSHRLPFAATYAQLIQILLGCHLNGCAIKRNTRKPHRSANVRGNELIAANSG